MTSRDDPAGQSPASSTRVLAGRFQLLAQAGAGGMGAVYRARDLMSGATVAVKILAGRDVRLADRFDQEATIMAGPGSPGDRPLHQPRGGRERRPLHRDGVDGRRGSGQQAGSRAAVDRRNDRHRAPHRRGAGPRARQRGRSPRHQARQPVPAGRRHRSPEGARLRHRPADQRGAQADPHRVGHRDARLHGARAGSRRARHQAQRGRLLAGLRSVPVPDRAGRCSRPRR